MILDPAILHPTYRAVVGPALDVLLADHPRCPLARVEVFRGRPGDRSLGNADERGVIRLSAYWFADRPLEDLREDARDGYLFTMPGCDEVMRWHGGMTEPQHLLAHEFAHVLGDAVPEHAAWARERWLAATAAPHTAVSGYAMVNPEEYWAEACAAALVLLDHPVAHAAREFLETHGL